MVVAHVLPREDGSATGRTKGGGDESIGEMGAFASEAIKTGGFEKLRSFLHEAQEIVAVIVAEDENDVFLFPSACKAEEEEESKEREGS